ncbi:TetR/AcrR family transcriptional regulator [Phytohabitans rumicis]|uniref:TetR family transcriptional regulator n=1 Tax=Phytohabitans rumicis TaxID=1076125 RepID=A0A6V8LC22_9ACTN|nr:TetR/AcrR family transcriptional regulator [Phytohabitans rumicis]GFJ94742.1 TetR family transcriptional regulator [Phytohabitans rumicis]
MATDVSASSELRDRFVAAGLEVLQEHGAAELTVRRVAEAAGSSTMGIYTRFGGRTGMLEAVYRRGFELLRDVLTAVPPGSPPDRIVALGRAYREFALANPALYALLFERPIAGFDPSPELRAEALAMNFTLLVDEVAAAGIPARWDPQRAAYLLWTAMHGIVSIELTHALRSPLPGWFLSTPEVGEQVLVEGVRAVLKGLSG